MTKKQRATNAVSILTQRYPASCSLDAVRDYELLFATRLAAQCTDARVNIVTKELYARYSTLESIAGADLSELEQIIKPCGLFHTKARDIIRTANMLLTDFGGKVPDTMEQLLTLPGVGRKTANLILSDIYGKPAVVTDTHFIRITNRLGLCKTKDPYQVELAMIKLIEPEEQAAFCHRVVHFGRDVCTARSPKCGLCPLAEICPKVL